MKPNRRQIYNLFLSLGMVFFAIGLATDTRAFSWIAIVFIVIALITSSGRWLKPRRR